MQTATKVGSTILRAGISLAGGFLFLTAVGGVAFAIDTAPEIDPGTIASAIGLFTASALFVTGRRFIK